MKLARKHRAIVVSIVVFVGYLLFCDYRIATGNWKFSDGDPVAEDIVSFDFKLFSFFRSELRSGGVKVCNLRSYSHGFSNDEIVIESIDGNLKGRYVRK